MYFKVQRLMLVLIALAIPVIKSNLRTNEFGLNVMDNYLSDAGFGWDYLEDSSRFPLFNYSFNERKRTQDGIYLVPDCMSAESVKRVEYSDSSEVIDTSYHYVSKYSSSIKYGGGVSVFGVGIGGSYSKDYSSMMESQKSTKTITTSTKYLDHRYNLKVNNRCDLDIKFKGAVNDIIFYLNSELYDLARYEVEKLVSEYGTHYLKSVKVGGMIYIDNYLSNQYWRTHSSQTTTIRKSASANFLGIVKISSSSSSTHSVAETETYNKNVKQTKVDSIGGAYKPQMSVDQWANTLENNLVTIDRELEVISSVFSPSNFPQIDATTLLNLNGLFMDAAKLYVNVNARSGCIDRRSIMYDPTANYAKTPNTCKETYRFGGTFAESVYCDKYDPATGKCVSSYLKCMENHLQTRNKSCPAGYKARTGFLSKNPRLNLTECYGLDGQKDNGDFLFGGIYSDKANNKLTGAKSCPENFVAFNLFDCNKNMICLSMDRDKSIDESIPFGGFVSSCIANRQCPAGMIKEFVNSYDGCDLHYCTRFDKQKNIPKVISLPISSFPVNQYRTAQELKKRLRK